MLGFDGFGAFCLGFSKLVDVGFCFDFDSFWGDLFVDFLIIWCCVLWLVCVCGLNCVLDVVGWVCVILLVFGIFCPRVFRC